MTVAVAQVLREFLDDVAEPRYGYELIQRTGFPSGKVYPILARLVHAGWLSKETEEIDPAAAGRPPRRMYRLTAEGACSARVELAALSARLVPSTVLTLRLRAEGGSA